jgi:hypothetical protein
MESNVFSAFLGLIQKIMQILLYANFAQPVGSKPSHNRQNVICVHQVILRCQTVPSVLNALQVEALMSQGRFASNATLASFRQKKRRLLVRLALKDSTSRPWVLQSAPNVSSARIPTKQAQKNAQSAHQVFSEMHWG